MRRWLRRLLLVVVVLAVALVATYGGLAASTSRSLLARALIWREADMDDHRRFPARPVAAGLDRFDFARPAGPGPRRPPCAGSRCTRATGGSSVA
jgi:hypothetical protein